MLLVSLSVLFSAFDGFKLLNVYGYDSGCYVLPNFSLSFKYLTLSDSYQTDHLKIAASCFMVIIIFIKMHVNVINPSQVI